MASLNITLECGMQTLDPEVQGIVKRRNNHNRIHQNIDLLKSSGIEFETHLIFGLPGQTVESLLRDYLFLYKYCPTLRLFLSSVSGGQVLICP